MSWVSHGKHNAWGRALEGGTYGYTAFEGGVVTYIEYVVRSLVTPHTQPTRATMMTVICGYCSLVLLSSNSYSLAIVTLAKLQNLTRTRTLTLTLTVTHKTPQTSVGG